MPANVESGEGLRAESRGGRRDAAEAEGVELEVRCGVDGGGGARTALTAVTAKAVEPREVAR